jgi:hypothetical protein
MGAREAYLLLSSLFCTDLVKLSTRSFTYRYACLSGEADTRAKLIDPALYTYGWTEDLIRREETTGAIEIVDGKPRKRGYEESRWGSRSVDLSGFSP